MSTNSKIRILCDLCGKLCGPQEVKQITRSTNPGYDSFWIEPPTFDGEHFICKGCLAKLGWKEQESEPAEKAVNNESEGGKEDGK